MLFAWPCGQVGKNIQGGLTEGRLVCFFHYLNDLEVCVFSCEKSLALSLVI